MREKIVYVAEEHNAEYQEAVWWLRAMNYIRTVSGTVYVDQLAELADYFDCPDVLRNKLKNSVNVYDDIENIKNIAVQENLMESYDGNFLKCDYVTNGIFTIPRSRKILDFAIWKLYDRYEFPEACLTYNKYFYKPLPNEEDVKITEFDNLSNDDIKEMCTEGFIVPDHSNKTISFDFTALSTNPDDCIYVKNFDLFSIINYVNTHPEEVGFPGKIKYSVGFVNARRTVFFGNIRFTNSSMTDKQIFKGRLCFNCAAFENDVNFNYAVFSCGSSNNGAVIDFRDACFHGNINFYNCTFESASSKTEITFEDAKIYGGLEFNNVNLGEININCFQAIFLSKNNSMDEYIKRVNFINTIFMGSSSVDLTDADFSSSGKSKIYFQNISNLPELKILLSATEIEGKRLCPSVYLLINNCTIQNTIYISNILMLSFYHSQNFSRIVAADDWADMPSVPRAIRFRQYFGKDGTGECPRTKTKGFIRTPIVNKLLLAVYNNDRINDFNHSADILNRSKGTDFLMLKENFASQGLYDSEDTAFILYMEYKPLINSMDKHTGKLKKASDTFLYKILYTAGKYGISPGRVIYAMFFVIAVFALIFVLFFVCIDKNSFSVGNTLSQWNESANEYVTIKFDGILNTLGVGILYSLENVIPFVSQFEAIDLAVCIFTAIENFIGSFLIGYFSVAVVRKTLR